MSAALREVAARSGVEVRRDFLLGWRDAGGFFKLRLGHPQQPGPSLAGGRTGGSSVVLLEAEQILIAPHPQTSPETFEVFGLRGGVQ
eukprot:scaffold250642_cov32-Prasinocladus_malaysianus.AAC.1